jgi:hypothetical protein
VLFFEKRTKKLLLVWFRVRASKMRQVMTASEQKFFGSFFQKRTLPFSCRGESCTN